MDESITPEHARTRPSLAVRGVLCAWVVAAVLLAGALLFPKAFGQTLCADPDSPATCLEMGAALTPVRPRLAIGGVYQEYANGEIETIDPQAAAAAGIGPFVLGAFREDKRIVIKWDYRGGGDFNKLLVRWELDDHEESVEERLKDDDQANGHQIELDFTAKGQHSFEPGGQEGTYVVFLKACDVDKVLFVVINRECGAWSPPVYVDVLPSLAAVTYVTAPFPIMLMPKPLPIPTTPKNQPTTGPGVYLDVGDPAAMDPAQITPLYQRNCDASVTINDPEDDRLGEVDTGALLARLGLIAANLNCRVTPNAVVPSDMLKAVNDALEHAAVVSVPGTDLELDIWIAALLGGATGVAAALLLMALPFFNSLSLLPTVALGLLIGIATGEVLATTQPRGDYDMKLVDLVRIAYLEKTTISADAYQHLISDLLTVRGPASERREFFYLFGLPTPAPESENHILMTESARYLTNNLLAQHYLDDGKPVPEEFDNAKNGMAEWFLQLVQEMLTQDMYELNARPYARLSLGALANMADLASYNSQPCAAIPSPGTTQSVDCDVARAARNVLDFLSAKFAVSSNELRRAAPFRRQPPFRHYPRLWPTGGDDMTWRMFAYTGGSNTFRDERHLRVMEGARGMLSDAHTNFYRPPVLITDLMRFSQGSTPYLQRFYSTRRDGQLVEVYYRDPLYLISAGGRHERGRGFANWLAGIFGFSHGEDAWALPTTLMPTRAGGDYRDFVRILGHDDDDARENTCVAPGFACGMNPAIPVGLPQSCMVRKDNWTFINFDANTGDCPFGWGFYVAVYSADCTTRACRDAAGSIDRAPTFGFFEAAPARNFETYMDEVLSLNGSWDYRFDNVNLYKSPFYGQTTFMLKHEKLEWPIVEYGPLGAGIKAERGIETWPIASGSPITSPRRGCVVIDNASLQQRLILDHIDWKRPRRAIVDTSRRCGCPLSDECLNIRAQ